MFSSRSWRGRGRAVSEVWVGGGGKRGVGGEGGGGSQRGVGVEECDVQRVTEV